MSTRTLLVIGAHPDDCEINVGGLAARWRARGDAVHFVSVTDGCRGHFADEYRADPAALVARREAEGAAAAAVIGASYRHLGVPDGEVYVDRPTTEAIVRCIRSAGEPGRGPDLVLFNRPLDYHRDHRYAAQMVLDATYMLTVPLLCPETRHLDRMPVFAYWWDDFRDTQPFRPEIAVPTDAVFEEKVSMVCQHASQFFEWLPYNAGVLDEVPDEAEGRRERVASILRRRGRHRREQGERARLRWPDDAPLPETAEVYQLCEYGRIPDDAALRALFTL